MAGTSCDIYPKSMLISPLYHVAEFSSSLLPPSVIQWPNPAVKNASLTADWAIAKISAIIDSTDNTTTSCQKCIDGLQAAALVAKANPWEIGGLAFFFTQAHSRRKSGGRLTLFLFRLVSSQRTSPSSSALSTRSPLPLVAGTLTTDSPARPFPVLLLSSLPLRLLRTPFLSTQTLPSSLKSSLTPTSQTAMERFSATTSSQRLSAPTPRPTISTSRTGSRSPSQQTSPSPRRAGRGSKCFTFRICTSIRGESTAKQRRRRQGSRRELISIRRDPSSFHARYLTGGEGACSSGLCCRNGSKCIQAARPRPRPLCQQALTSRSCLVLSQTSIRSPPTRQFCPPPFVPLSLLNASF